jgi:hypothetical protein
MKIGSQQWKMGISSIKNNPAYAQFGSLAFPKVTRIILFDSVEFWKSKIEAIKPTLYKAINGKILRGCLLFQKTNQHFCMGFGRLLASEQSQNHKKKSIHKPQRDLRIPNKII